MLQHPFHQRFDSPLDSGAMIQVNWLDGMDGHNVFWRKLWWNLKC